MCSPTLFLRINVPDGGEGDVNPAVRQDLGRVVSGLRALDQQAVIMPYGLPRRSESSVLRPSCRQLPRFGQSEPCSPAGTLPMPLKTNF
jgi:hypothetical protein